MGAPDPVIFIVTFRVGGADPFRRLRWMLKYAWRVCRMRCVSVRLDSG